ncbi:MULTISPECIES: NAD-dependent epimerase/dehydratase family protein [unclassified Streptomyces]|uniref:NAD-dependent epimerase/dehydratase family protein n=1 Tax=unclassified Streptomyces TaxID=2593676 RepID=UPI002DDB4FA2|nr:NAD(P)-dependent oxidoreductase [Streptomyces sp. NBC_01237]WRZ73444.1 NAD(P)-dependent oxidoreductase [Streptomyces sp. NBC_01237]
MTGTRIVVTGGTGFIGAHVAKELLARDGVTVRFAGRRPVHAGTPGVEWVRAELTDSGSLHGICEDADVLVHLASKVSGTEESCRAVNEAGTAALMAEAVRAGTPRVVHLSTTAVYGRGPHTGQDIPDLTPAPVSAASATRLAGEQHALRAGAVVLRAGLVLGTGDLWVVTALAELLKRVPGRWAGGAASLSVVDASDLGRLITAVALAPAPPGPAVFHAAHPRPVRIGDLVAALAEHGIVPPPADEDWSWDRCLQEHAGRPGIVSERQFHLLAQDHWYRSDAVWQRTGVEPGPGPLDRLAASADWYRTLLA